MDDNSSGDTTSLENEIKQSWHKVANDSKLAGFREGISDGHDSNFQKYFDKGFREGFKNGFTIGKHKGMLKANSIINPNINETAQDCLRHSKRGWCQMCADNELLLKKTDEIVQHQNTFTDKQMIELSKKVNLNTQENMV